MADNRAITATPGDVPAGHKPLFDSVAKLFEDPKFSDFVIKCNGVIWNVHKNIVGARSDFFEKACGGQFKERLDGVITLQDDDECIVHEMLRYLYTADFQDQPSDAQDSGYTPMLCIVHVHTIADKYNIPALAELASAKFAARATGEWNTEDFANAIEEMYATAPHSKKAMHTCAVNTAVEHAKELYAEETGKRFREVADKTPAFSSALAAELASGKNKRKREGDEYLFTCPHSGCSKTWVTTKTGGDNRTYMYCPGCCNMAQFASGVPC